MGHLFSFQDVFVLLHLIGHADVQFKNWFEDTKNEFARLQKIGKSHITDTCRCMNDLTELSPVTICSCKIINNINSIRKVLDQSGKSTAYF